MMRGRGVFQIIADDPTALEAELFDGDCGLEIERFQVVHVQDGRVAVQAVPRPPRAWLHEQKKGW